MTMYSRNPGRYRQRVVIQRQVQTRDQYGGVLLEWVDLFKVKVPAEVLTGPGREMRAANADQAETTARINFRWFPGLTQDMRILWDGRVYNISSVETDSTGRLEWRLQCEDGVNDGR